MKFDVNNLPEEPDSDLDPDLDLEQTYTIAGGKQQKIAPGDWVDVDESMITPDAKWGFSFQCSATGEFGVIQILVYDAGLEGYVSTYLSTSLITNNFRRKPPEAA